jgi:beta-1,4-mannosyl-glycoprotein beta-1,4-N-acetylglucosaminyltransferase
MKIIDCFIFYNEMDMLTYRLNLLDPVVDNFILVESTHTHAGNKKNLYYNDNKESFAQFNDKIIHIIIDDFPFKFPNINYLKNEQWINENYQRNMIKRGLEKLSLEKDDIIILSDLDEIPHPTTLKKIKNGLIRIDTISALDQDMYYYNLNTFMGKWDLSKIINYEYYLKQPLDLTSIRLLPGCKMLSNGGWHLSYFGDSNFIKNKLEQFTHQEFNSNKFTNTTCIKNKIENSLDLFGRKQNIIKIPETMNTHLPSRYKEFLSKYVLF